METEKVTLPSGLSVNVQHVSILELADQKLLALALSYSAETGDLSVHFSPQELYCFAVKIIVAGVISPRFYDPKNTAEQADAVSVDDLDQEDFFYLANEIITYSRS